MPQAQLTENSNSCQYYDIDQFNSTIRTINNKDISLLHMNIRSLDRHWGEFISLLNSLDFNFDIIALTEIGTKNLKERTAFMKDYNFYYDVPLKNKFGGAGILVKKELKVTERRDLKICSEADMETENVWYEITDNKNKLIVGTVYRHPGNKNNMVKFCEKLENIISVLENNNIKCIICGDINILQNTLY